MIRSLFLFALVSLSASNMIGCNNTNSDELAKVKAEAEAARAEVARLKAVAQPTVPAIAAKVKVSGEIYATTKGGDIKKGAGLGVYLIPVTPTARELIADAIGQFDAIGEFKKGYELQQRDRFPLKFDNEALFSSLREERKAQENAYDRELAELLGDHSNEYLIARAAEESLHKSGILANTNSDGRFEIDVPVGEYLLVTDERKVGQEALVWVKAFSVSGAEVRISLDQKSAVFGGGTLGTYVLSVSSRNVLEAMLRQSGPWLPDRVRQAQLNESAFLNKLLFAKQAAQVALPPVAKKEVQSHLPPVVEPVVDEASLEEEKKMKVIFKDWASRRGEALKKAAKMQQREGDAFMQRIDQGLVKSLTAKYKITHEELDRIEAYGAKKNWW